MLWMGLVLLGCIKYWSPKAASLSRTPVMEVVTSDEPLSLNEPYLPIESLDLSMRPSCDVVSG